MLDAGFCAWLLGGMAVAVVAEGLFILKLYRDLVRAHKAHLAAAQSYKTMLEALVSHFKSGGGANDGGR